MLREGEKTCEAVAVERGTDCYVKTICCRQSLYDNHHHPPEAFVARESGAVNKPAPPRVQEEKKGGRDAPKFKE